MLQSELKARPPIIIVTRESVAKSDSMMKITLDHSAMTIYHRHPAMRGLGKLEEEGKVRIYHSHNLNRELGSLKPTEERIYSRLRDMVFGRKQEDLNLAEHADLLLLINHMKSKRDFFVTMDVPKYECLRGHGSLDVRFPDEALISEIEARLLSDKLLRLKAERRAKRVEAAKKAKRALRASERPRAKKVR